MKKKISNIIFFLILIIILIYTFYFTEYDFNSIVSNYDTLTYLILLVVFFLSFILGTLFLKVNLSIFDKKTSILMLFCYTQASNFLNYLPMKAGVILLGKHLKDKISLNYKDYFVTIFVNYFYVTIYSLLFFVSSIYLSNRIAIVEKITINSKVIYSLPIIAIIVIMFLFFTNLTDKLKIVSQKLKNLSIKLRNPFLVLNYTTLSLLQIIFYSIRMYISFKILGKPISFIDSITIGSILNFTFLISITPGGIGMKEGITSITTYLLYGDPEIGVIASLFDRTFNFILTMFSGLLSLIIIKRDNLNQN
ncbi:MAG: flippase-like domain-containing protein [Candidatus Delongbacteria bacterium]|nr:flippase-like domain-containing protein [Candidatus Delongbacteria bacterium]MBN2835871.1 flippase-like domain-containing protein [Candidatus Delongbacteria bacterium]